MRKKEMVILLVLVLVLITIISTFLIFNISPSYIARVISATGGEITNINISTQTASLLWQGYLGNITNSVSSNSTAPSGGGITGFNIYSTCPNDQTGEIYFSTTQNIDFSLLVPATQAEVDAMLGVPSTDSASATNVFTSDAVFEIYDTNLTLKSVQTNSATANFRTGLLKQGSDLIFVCDINQDSQSYQDLIVDYQALLPAPIATTYYTFTDPRNTCPTICGDGTCEGSETQFNCPVDCGIPPYCGDGTCQANETQFDCAVDCGFPPYCGDGTCQANETQVNCPSDCGVPTCGDSICAPTETYDSCPADCQTPGICPDNICQVNETCSNCETDCGACQTFEKEYPEQEEPITKPPKGDPYVYDSSKKNKPIETKERFYFTSAGTTFSQKKFMVDPVEIDLTINQGNVKSSQIRILSTYTETFILDVHTTNLIDEFIIYSSDKMVLNKDIETTTTAMFSIPQKTPPGLYQGTIYFVDQTGTTRISIPVKITVIKTNRVFDLDIKVLSKAIKPGEEVNVEVKIDNVPNKEVDYKIEMIDPFSLNIISSFDDKRTINGNLERIISLQTNDDLNSARYLIKAQAVFQNDASQQIKSTDASYVIVLPKSILYYITYPFWMIILVLSIIFIKYIFTKSDLIIKHKKTATFVFYNQLFEDLSGIKKLKISDKRRNKIVFVESKEFFRNKIDSLQKTDKEETYRRIILFTSEMRNFAKELSSKGYDVHYYRSDNLENALSNFTREFNIEKLYITNDRDPEIQRITKELVLKIPTGVEIIN